MVLATKYRPKNFDELIGQDNISKTLKLALMKKRLSNAYLFSGIRGSGKTSTARIFAKALVCEFSNPNPCGKCDSCKSASEKSHLDIIEMDAASNRKIEDIQKLIEHTKYAPSMSKYKVFIIDEVHMLTRESFNALLKTLEEPPSFIKFILATTDPLKLPATILSRTQHFRFKPISKENIANHLENILTHEGINYERKALELLARNGHGSLRDTLTLLDQAIIFSDSNVKASSVSDMLGFISEAKIKTIFDAIFSKNIEEIKKLIIELETFECEAIIDELIFYTKDRFLEQDSNFTALISERFFRILNDAKELLFLNADGGFVLSLVFFKMIESLNLKHINEMIEPLEKEVFQTNQAQNIQNPQIQQPPKPPKSKVIHDTKTPKVDEASFLLFKELNKKLYDRNYELGECFEKSVSFVSFEENILTLQSNAKDECQSVLRNSSRYINFHVKEVFGLSAKIKMQNNDLKKKSNPNDKLNTDATNEQNTNTTNSTTLENEQNTTQEIHKNTQNHISDNEINTNHENKTTPEIHKNIITKTPKEQTTSTPPTTPKEKPTNQISPEIQNILDDPLLKKVESLFKAKEVKIQKN